jgi:hypothetical protein
MLIIGSGVFEGLAEDAGPAELVAVGFSAEFVSRFPVILRLDRLSPEHLMPIYREAVAGAVTTATDFGYEVVIGDNLLRYVANAVASGADTVTPRAGMGWLQAAVDSALLRLLDLSARPGTRYEIRPDDVRIPGGLRPGRPTTGSSAESRPSRDPSE